MPFPNPGDVYFSMINVFMESQMEDIAFILNAGYKTLIYDGNFDIICNHSGVLDMIADMQWDGKADYDKVSLKLPKSDSEELDLKFCFLKLSKLLPRLVGRLTTMGPRWLAT